MTLVAKLTAALVAGAAASSIASTLATPPAIARPAPRADGLADRKDPVTRSKGLADRKDPAEERASVAGDAGDAGDARDAGARNGGAAGEIDDAYEEVPLLATLLQTHTGERVPLDAHEPTQARFDALLADRATGDERPLDDRLLGLLRELAERHPGSRIELVSGYRSWKLNEMLRKKGHHVASHSQHSLGHACDFRIVPPEAELALDPRVVEAEIRKLGWTGGVGVYPTRADWFVHADVGRDRAWTN